MLNIKSKKVLNGIKLDKNYVFYKKNIIFSLYSFFLVGIFYVALFLPFKILYPLRVINKMNFKKIKGKGAVLTFNHSVPLDGFMLASSIFPRSAYFPTLEINFKGKILNFIFSSLKTVPLPKNLRLLPYFLLDMKKVVKDKKIVAVAPEGNLGKYRTYIDTFKKGAFKIAKEQNAPILPIAFWYIPRKFGKMKFVMIVGEPVFDTACYELDDLVSKIYDITKKLIMDFNFERALKGKKIIELTEINKDGKEKIENCVG
ncbi:MAG: 1-acyl-sn-glycerol-3-phosphate acyltransferase [Clostridia bacterium]